MSPHTTQTVIASAIIVLLLIRAPHLQRCRKVRVLKRKHTVYSDLPLALVILGLLLPMVWVFSDRLEFADYPPVPGGLLIGALCFLPAVWLCHRSHVDLGTNWSITLEVRENHRLVTRGIYQRIRHPMYLSLLLFALGLAIAVPNYLAGPSMLVTMIILFCLRVGPEERMMQDEFGDDYENYRKSSRRLIPGFW